MQSAEPEETDVWDEAGESALANLTATRVTAATDAREEEEDDFDFDVRADEESSAANNVNGPPLVKLTEKRYVEGTTTLNILSPAIGRKGEDSFVKTLNRPVHDTGKVLNSTDLRNLHSPTIQKRQPDKQVTLPRDSSIPNDLNAAQGTSSYLTPNIVTEQNVSEEWVERELGGSGSEAPSQSPLVLSTPLLSYQEAVQHFKGIDMSVYEPDIITSLNLSGLTKFFAQLCGPPRMKSELKNEKTFIFCLARCQFDNEDPTDFQFLLTIYKSLTGTTLDCARFGSHWQDIGFQGSDPATDLRGTGMLSLLTILYLVREHNSLALKLYQLSLSETQNFPLCVLLINLTRIALSALRSGYLNKECNRRFAILPIFCELFGALSLEHYKMWKQGKTIRDSGFVLKRLEERTKSTSACMELMGVWRRWCNEKDGIFEKSDIVFLNVTKEKGYTNAQSRVKKYTAR